nr:TlpA disulfide reductase family protein [Pedobacter sp. ASV19]
MKLYINAIALVLGLILATNGYSKTKTTSVKPSDVVIEGVVLDKDMLASNYLTTVSVIISKYPFPGIEVAATKYKRYEFKCHYGEKFKIIIPALSDLFYAQIDYYPPKVGGYFSSFDNVYMLKKGDRIACKLYKTFFEFSGKGAARLQCQSEIYKANYIIGEDDIPLLRAKQYEKSVATVNHKMDSCLSLQLEIIKRYKSKLDKYMIDILLANCYGLRYYNTIRGYRNQRFNIPLYNAFKNNEDYKYIADLKLPEIDPIAKARSPVYVNFLFEKIRFDAFTISKDGEMESGVSRNYIKSVYSDILKNYNGIIRDKLLALFFITYSPDVPIQNYLDEAIVLVKRKEYKDILLEIQKTRLDGLPFYDFELEDVNGRKIKLTDFTNKVVLVDFWYTGCMGCALLKEAMAPVLERFKNNSSVVFLSISIDKDIDKWKKSVASGIYTDSSGVNLYTGGLGDKHPLIRHYDIAAYPQLFLLKNGSVFSSTPPWPELDQNRKPVLNGATSELINLVEEAISKL